MGVWSLGREDPWRRAWEHTPVFLPRESRGQRSLAGCGPSVQFSPVTQLCLTLYDPMNCSMPGLPVHHQLLESTQTQVHWVGDAIQHLIICCPLLLPPSIFPSIRVFSKESVLHIRWPKYWSSSFNISPSDEYSGLSSLVTNNVEHLMCLLTICMSS